MSLSGIFSSAHQRRSFLIASCTLLALCFLAILWIASIPQPSPALTAFNSFLTSVVASGAFAILSTLYISFFVDPNEVQKAAVVLPQDISQNLDRIVAESVDYQISVRTGRHFRADTLPEALGAGKETSPADPDRSNLARLQGRRAVRAVRSFSAKRDLRQQAVERELR